MKNNILELKRLKDQEIKHIGIIKIEKANLESKVRELECMEKEKDDLSNKVFLLEEKCEALRNLNNIKLCKSKIRIKLTKLGVDAAKIHESKHALKYPGFQVKDEDEEMVSDSGHMTLTIIDLMKIFGGFSEWTQHRLIEESIELLGEDK